MKKILIIVIIVVIAGGAGAFFALSKSHGKKTSKQPKEGLGETVALDPEFVVNLADQEPTHYLKISITLEIEPAAGSKEKVEKATPFVRDAMVMALSKHKYKTLLTDAGKQSLKKELLTCASKPLGEEGIKVRNVLIPSFVME
jgi:flagellar protein FliL